MEIRINDHLSNWESLIDTIDKSEIPLEFVNSIILEFIYPQDGEESMTININNLRDGGFTGAMIQDIVNETLNDFNNNIKAMDFYLDVEHVANTVQQETNKLLKDTI